MQNEQRDGNSFARSGELEAQVLQLTGELAQCREDLAHLEIDLLHFGSFTDAIPDHAFVALDPDGQVIRWNKGAEQVMGWSSEDIIGQPAALFYTIDDVNRGIPLWERQQAAQLGTIKEEQWHRRRDGNEFWGSGSLSAIRSPAGELLGFTKVMRDGTKVKEAQDKLRESEERLRLFIENVTDYALLQVDPSSRISSWNVGAERTFGYSEPEIQGAPMRLLYLPDEAARGDAEKDLEEARRQGRFEDARWLSRKDGTRFFGRWVTTPMWDKAGSLHGYAKVLRDETERRASEEQLQVLLTEKEALLQEVHHRVKNNLQVISSILSIQTARTESPELSVILADTENRVRAIAALHETLYSSEDLGNIEFGSYIQHLVGNLASFYGVTKKVDLSIQVADLVVEIGQAIPLGLIVNELVTNALKHAFPDGHTGALRIDLRYLPETVDTAAGQTLDEGWGELTVSDNGVGLPPALEFGAGSSMGLYLINVLTRQLRGKLQVNSPVNPLVDSGPGTSIQIAFPLAAVATPN